MEPIAKQDESIQELEKRVVWASLGAFDRL